MAFSPAVMAFFSLGVFMPVLAEVFDWTRTEISAASTIGTLSCAVFTPFIGRMVDVYGVKKIIVLALSSFVVAFSSFYFLNASLTHFYGVYFILGIIIPVTTLSINRVIVTWFNRRRGIALGLAMAGTGIGTAIMPPIAQNLIELYGWRLSYLVLGVLAGCIIIPLVVLFLREQPSADDEESKFINGADKKDTNLTDTDCGLQPSEAIKTSCFWKLITIFFLIALSLHGMGIHFVPIIIDTGIPALKAAGFMTILGVSVIFGRLACGYMIDYIFAPYVICGIFTLSAIGIGILAIDTSVLTFSISAVLIGLGVGAETDALGYLIARYFGLKKFGEIYGYVFSAFMLGTSVGPLFLGFAYDLNDSYRTGIISLAIVTMLAAVTVVWLGQFPRWGVSTHE